MILNAAKYSNIVKCCKRFTIKLNAIKFWKSNEMLSNLSNFVNLYQINEIQPNVAKSINYITCNQTLTKIKWNDIKYLKSCQMLPNPYNLIKCNEIHENLKKMLSNL